jgi:apolipoprotein N-acyltransferase
MTGPQALLVCLLSGAALSFAFPEPSIAPLAWASVAPLLVIARGSARKGFAYGLVFGLGFFGSLLIWVKVVGWAAWVVLVFMEALYLAGFGAAWGVVSRSARGWWVVTAPALWVTFETFREAMPVVGFPWGQLAQSQGVFPWLLQMAQVGGGKTVSVVLLAVNVMLALAWSSRGVVRWRWVGAGVAVIVAMVPLTYVIPQIDGSPASGSSEPLRVAIVQGNASPGVQVEDERERVRRHLELTRSLADERLDLVVWPESSVGIDPFIDDDVRSMVSDAAQAVGAPMIVGANLDVGEDNYKVTALLVDEAGEITDTYQKTHLVPFGEYLPQRAALDWIPVFDQIPRDAIAGNEPKNLEVSATYKYDIATVISFEGDFGHLVRDRVDMGASLIVVATNTSTWERTWASAQHLAMSQVRAAENRVPVVHAALSGISAAVNFNGTVAERSDLYEEDTLVFTTTPNFDTSIYARTGEWLPILCLLVSVASVGLVLRRRSTVPA